MFSEEAGSKKPTVSQQKGKAKFMGDRGNIVVRQGKTNRDDVWFYTHWYGSNIDEVVNTALAKHERWDDPSYLARIIFDTLTAGHKGTTGFGISTSISDNEHPLVVVDCQNQTVWTIEEKQLDEHGRIPDGFTPKTKRAFSSYLAGEEAP